MYVLCALFPSLWFNSPEVTSAGIFRLKQQESRSYISRNIQFPATGDQKLHQQEYSGSSNRRPEATAA
jgi:hypothetical protein